MLNPRDTFFESGVIPVVIIQNAADAVPLARALLRGGISAIEFTLRTEAGIAAIEAVHREIPEILVGAGTVSCVEDARQSVEAGAQFIITPGLNESVVYWCKEHNISVYPGVSSASEIETALSWGLTELKFFPAEAVGGIKLLKSFSSPYGKVKFIPTGGINMENLPDYLALPNVIACGGSWICSQSLIAEKQFDQIEILAKNAVRQVLGFELYHIGINCDSPTQAKETAELFSSLFLTDVQERPNAYFAGNMAEILKAPYLGVHGHIGISTNNFARAKRFLEKQGIQFRESGYVENVVAYLQDEIAGFAFHLKQK